MGMQDTIDELTRENDKLAKKVERLEKANDTLKEDVMNLQAQNQELLENAPVQTPEKKFVRGKLPGEIYIKTDRETGVYEVIDRAEWDTLPNG